MRHGYDVSAEVGHCDIAAVKDDELIVIELKRSANLTLLIQATERQRITDAVYVALPEPARNSRHFLGVERLLKRLGLGLITVRFGPLGPAADKRFDPAPVLGNVRGNKRNAVLREIAGRSENFNVGGSHQTAIMTAYRETALFIACCLERLGPSSTRDLRALGTGAKTTSVLARNHYGWFERVSRGVYRITPPGIAAVHRHPALRARALAKLAETSSDPAAPEA